MYWDQQTSPQLDQLDRNIPVILPISATEQHGAHLPLATDRLIGEHFLRKLNQEMSIGILILPSVGIACSEHHTQFAGSLTLTHDTFVKQLTDICNSVLSYGFKNILIFNSHGGNQAVGQVFLEQFGFRNPNARIALVTWWRIAFDALKELTTTPRGGVGHAGEFETSLMLLIAPELVHMDKITPKANIPGFDWAEGDLLYGPKASFYRTMKAMTPTGVYGEAAAASKEKGEAITEVVISALGQIVLDLKSIEP